MREDKVNKVIKVEDDDFCSFYPYFGPGNPRAEAPDPCRQTATFSLPGQEVKEGLAVGVRDGDVGVGEGDASPAD